MGELEVKETSEMTRRRGLTVQRMGSALFLLILIAALAGLLGTGPLSSTSTGEKDSALWIEYNRFLRHGGPTALKIHVGADRTTNGFTQIRLSKRFITETEIEHVEPAPVEVASGDSFTFTFRTATNQASQITIRFQPNHFGTLAYEVSIPAGPRLPLRHFAYP